MRSIHSRSLLIVSKNYGEFCSETAKRIQSLSEEVIRTSGRFTIALAGGATPKGIYSLMGSASYRDKFQWQKMHFFWGDERWVPPDDPISNYHMVAETLLIKTDIPPENIHPIRTKEKDASSSARLYEKELTSFFELKPGETPHFDLILLGVGQDGHIASLFPDDPALAVTDCLVTPVHHTETQQERVSVTLPLINRGTNIFFLVSGREKAEVLKKIFGTKEENADLPAQKVKPQDGTVTWFVDQGAVTLLSPLPQDS